MISRKTFIEEVLKIDGVADILYLDRKHRVVRGATDKFFIILCTHDIDRDAKIVDLFCDIEDYDISIDLVPLSSSGMVSGIAKSVKDEYER